MPLAVKPCTLYRSECDVSPCSLLAALPGASAVRRLSSTRHGRKAQPDAETVRDIVKAEVGDFDEKVSTEIGALDKKLSAEIGALDKKLVTMSAEFGALDAKIDTLTSVLQETLGAVRQRPPARG